MLIVDLDGRPFPDPRPAVSPIRRRRAEWWSQPADLVIYAPRSASRNPPDATPPAPSGDPVLQSLSRAQFQRLVMSPMGHRAL